MQLGIDSRKGTRFNLTRIGSGHTFGETAFFLGQPTLHEARADTDVAVLKLGRDAVDELMACSVPFSKALLSVACLRDQMTLTHIGDAAKMPLNLRVAKWLIRNSASADAKKDGAPARIAMRQIDLANALGVSRVSIGKTLKLLSEEGCIEIGYGSLTITDRHALSAKILVP